MYHKKVFIKERKRKMIKKDVLKKVDLKKVIGGGGASGTWMDSKTKACINGQAGGMLAGSPGGLGGIIIGGIGGAIAGGCFG